MVRKKKTEEPKVNKGKELFDFINGIYTDQTSEFFDSLSEVERKRYKASRYMIHRFLSMNPYYAPIVNEIQKYYAVPDRAHYLFLSNLIPKGRQFNKYVKGARDSLYEEWLVSLLAKHFQVSKSEAMSYLDIYYRHNKESLRQLCAMYGIDNKALKSVKLL